MLVMRRPHISPIARPIGAVAPQPVVREGGLRVVVAANSSY
jgi:hypothetical protein